MEQKDILFTQAKRAVFLYKYGKISREEALETVQPYVDLVNETSTRLAKEYGAKPRYISANSFLR